MTWGIPDADANRPVCRNADAKNRCEELMGLKKAWDVTTRTDDVAVRLGGNADGGEAKYAFRG
jgi:hypothetical protein